MGRIRTGTNAFPGGRVTLGLEDGSELTGTQSDVTEASDDGSFVIRTQLSRVPAGLDTDQEVQINLPDGGPVSASVKTIDRLPDGGALMTLMGRVPGGTH